jgi:hypothetical protein
MFAIGTQGTVQVSKFAMKSLHHGLNQRVNAVFAITILVFSAPFAYAQSSKLGPASCRLTDKDYVVYSALVDSIGTTGGIAGLKRDAKPVVHNRTINTAILLQSRRNDWPTFKQAPRADTLKNFGTRSKCICILGSRFTSKIPPRLVDDAQLSAIFKKNGSGWSKFYKLYPNSDGLWEFSAVGYGDNGSEAVVNFVHTCSRLCGTGNLVLLVKQNGKWTVKNQTVLWRS